LNMLQDKSTISTFWPTLELYLEFTDVGQRVVSLNHLR